MSDSIEYLRKEAKKLLKLCRAEDAAAIARLRPQLQRAAALNDSEFSSQIRLADVHHAMARERGVLNWSALKSGTDAPLEEFLAAVRNGDADAVKRPLKSAAEEWAEENIFAACVLGDVDAVAALLTADPSLAIQTHETWLPVHYTCASPIHKLSKRHAAGIFHCAELLLKDDLDLTLRSINVAQSSARDSGNHALVSLLARHGGKISALAAFSSGTSAQESRKREEPQPAVFQTPEFRAFLMQRKAQRPVVEKSAQMKEMAELAEESRKRREEAMKRNEESRSSVNIHTPRFQQRAIVPPPPLPRPQVSDEEKELGLLRWAPWIDAEVWRYALDHGLDPNWQGWGLKQTMLHHLAATVSLGPVTRDDPGMVRKAIEVVEMFLTHGADPNLPREDGRTAYVQSIRGANPVIASILEKYGANTASAIPADFLAGACERMDLKEARAIAESNSGILDTIPIKKIEDMFLHTIKGRLDRIRFMGELGFDLNRFGECAATLLHLAAWHGQVDVVRLLLEFRTDPNIRDTVYGCSPLAWAAHGSTNCRDSDDDYIAIVNDLRSAGATYPAAVNRRDIGPEAVATPKVTALFIKSAATE